jgi:hypothetical protein
MPVRINLLAEQQELEAARRRDPVKRAIWVGGLLAFCMLGWALVLQLQISGLNSELARDESRLLSVENESKDLRNDWQRIAEIDQRIAALARYSTNRFFVAPTLDALQRAVADNVRVIGLETSHSYVTNSEARFKTNISIALPKAPRFQLFAAAAQGPDVESLINAQVGTLTNRPQFMAAKIKPEVKTEITRTKSHVRAAISINRPVVSSERIALNIRARDYSASLGGQVDEFFQNLAALPYFAERLHKTEGRGIRLRERGILPEADSQEGTQFIPFAIECNFEEMVRSNE